MHRTKGKDEIEQYEHIFYVSVENSLRMMNFETFYNDDYVQSQVDLPYSMNNHVYTPGTTSEKILEVCREHYLQKYPYKEPQVTPNIILGEITSIWFRRRIDDVYPKDERDVDDYLDWNCNDDEDEDYHPSWDRWA